MPYTHVMDRVWQCDDCGAHAGSPRDIKHHTTCQAGESKKWEEFYNNTNAWINCNFFEVIDWDEDTQEIYHAVCTMPSTCWANCGSCTDRVPVGNMALRMARWVGGRQISLRQADIDILDGSKNRTVRIDTKEDAEVKYLYDMWKSL